MMFIKKHTTLILYMALGGLILEIAFGAYLLWSGLVFSPPSPGAGTTAVEVAFASATATAPPTPEPPTPSATATLTSTPAEAIATPLPAIIQHTVGAGETLSTIAQIYGVSVEDILAVNPDILSPDLIQAGQALLIPIGSVETILRLSATPDPGKPVAYAGVSYTPSDTNELASVYPLQVNAFNGQMLIHYQSASYTDRNLQTVLTMLTDAYQLVETTLGYTPPHPLDIYLAGSLFQGNESLRGLTQSALFRSFMLVDGALDPGEQTYLFAHELTHVFSYNKWGRYHAPMIHEGLATYVPQSFLVYRAGYLPIDEICRAAQEADRLPSIRTLTGAGYGPPYFAGHIRSFLYYNQSACFVKFLIERYGWDAFGQVFSSGNYIGVYGKNLPALEAEWQEALAQTPLTVDAQAFVAIEEQVAAAYQDYFRRVSGGGHADWNAYLLLNRAGLAAHRGQLAEAEDMISAYYSQVSADQP